MRYVEFMKRVVPLHDDLFDFFYEALPGYEHVGRRRADLVCWGSLNDPEHCDFKYDHMTNWGRKMFVTPGVVGDGKLRHQRPGRDQPRHPDPARPLVLRGLGEPGDVRDPRPAGQPGRPQPPVEPAHDPQAAKRDFDDKYSWVMSPRWFDGKDHLAADTGGGPIARLWSTALGGLVDIGYVKATGHSVVINLPRTVTKPEVTFEWKIPTVEQRARAQPGPDLLPGLRRRLRAALLEKALAEVRAGHTKTWEPFSVPDEAISCGFTEAVRGVLSATTW